MMMPLSLLPQLLLLLLPALLHFSVNTSVAFVAPPLPPPPQHRLARTGPTVVRLAAGGDSLILTEENVELVLSDCRKELSTLFGYSEENRNVGITGEVNFVEVDGPCVVVELVGRFWHEKSVVLARVENFIQERIPECIEVNVSDPSQLNDADPTQSELIRARGDDES